MDRPRNYSNDGELGDVRVASPHPAGPARSQRLHADNAPTEFSGASEVHPGGDPYRTARPKKDRSGALVRIAIFALLIGAGVAVWASNSANEPAPVLTEQAITEPAPIAVQPSEALPAIEPDVTPAP